MVMGKKNIIVLWVDDRRNPLAYLKKKPEIGNEVLQANLDYYNEFMKKYNPQFIWVKSFSEFKSYIIKNGLPDFVSFDRDLNNGKENGEACAQWLVNYCKENGLRLPDYYAHTANKTGKKNIHAIMKGQTIGITEQDIKNMVCEVVKRLTEDVFANKSTVDNQNNTIGLTYRSHTDRNSGNLTSADMLGTDKMETSNGDDTYEVTLKGGIKSYNITSIKGEAVMHYFKNKFENKAKKAKMKYRGNEYELMMEEPEFQRFMQIFNAKVNRVVNYHINKFEQEGKEFKPSKVSIYPVPSSSNFNTTMAVAMSHMTMGGLPVRVANEEILKKDLKNLKRDEEFIEKNKDYFYGKMSQRSTENGNDHPVVDFLDRDINKHAAINAAKKYVEMMNISFKKMYSAWQNYKTTRSETTLAALVLNYKNYFDAKEKCLAAANYENPVRDDTSTSRIDAVAKALKYSKGRSIGHRSKEIWKIVKPYLKKQKCPVTNEGYYSIEINEWEEGKFQIKTLTNGERMGLRDFYTRNEDPELVEKELNEIKGGVLVIFDDNISGGATLSDICYQFKEMGVEYLIPITFGKMSPKWTMGRIPLSQPKGGAFNY